MESTRAQKSGEPMSTEPISENLSIADKANEAFTLITQDVIDQARRFKTKIAIWRNGQIVQLTPDEVDAELANQKLRASLK